MSKSPPSRIFRLLHCKTDFKQKDSMRFCSKIVVCSLPYSLHLLNVMWFILPTLSLHIGMHLGSNYEGQLVDHQAFQTRTMVDWVHPTHAEYSPRARMLIAKERPLILLPCKDWKCCAELMYLICSGKKRGNVYKQIQFWKLSRDLSASPNKR